MPPEANGKVGDRGWALVSVLWVLAILALLAAAAQTLTYTSARGERHLLERALLNAALDAGVARAIAGITDARLDQRWPVDGTPQRFVYDGVTLAISIQDETGRIDLNAADGSLLRQLLASAGESPDRASALVDKILDWRSSTNLKRLQGASDADYAAAGLNYRPRHGAFQTVDELRLVLGMTPELFAKLRPALTVYSKKPAIDPNVAPREALLAYYPDQPAKVEALLRLRGSSRGGAAGAALGAEITGSGHAFSVIVVATDSSMGRTREAVFALTSSPDKPVLIFNLR